MGECQGKIHSGKVVVYEDKGQIAVMLIEETGTPHYEIVNDTFQHAGTVFLCLLCV